MAKVTCTQTANQRRIYSIPVRSFPNLITNVLVISDGSSLTLVDTGSGVHHSNQDLLDGFAAVAEEFGEPITLADLDTILITHAHIDHYGALPFIREHNQTAAIGIHTLDRAVIEHNEERAILAANRLKAFLVQGGVSAEIQAKLMQSYFFSKSFYRSMPVQFPLEDGVPTVNEIMVHHVPGHCPGLVCLQVDDVLITADHILSHTTPHQSPEVIVQNMGLRHYFESLEKIKRLDGISLGIGLHEDPMPNLKGRIDAIRQMHERRLEKIVGIIDRPMTISDISLQLFGNVKKFHVLLALEETGAHVEYLHQHGQLVATNLAELQESPIAPILYAKPT